MNGPDTHAFNFGLQRYRGADVLVWWNGTIFPEPVGRGNGEVVMLDTRYEHVHTVTLAGNFAELGPGARFASNIDLHGILLTDRGTVVVTGNNVTQADLTSAGGSADGWTLDPLVYELDVATNEILFEWRALDHLDQLPFAASVYPLGAEGFTGEKQSLSWGYIPPHQRRRAARRRLPPQRAVPVQRHRDPRRGRARPMAALRAGRRGLRAAGQ